jgi:hypothetical protein
MAFSLQHSTPSKSFAYKSSLLCSYDLTHSRGFIVPLLIIIIAVLALGGGAYVYNQNQVAGKHLLMIHTDFF